MKAGVPEEGGRAPRGAIRIEVRGFANLADFLPGGAQAGTLVELPEAATVEELTRRLGLPSDLPRLTLVNGEEVEPDSPLGEGDVVHLLPPLVGG